MANYGPDDILLLVDGYNVGIDVFETPVTTSAVLEDSSTWGDSWKEMAFVGVKDGELTVRGFYNDANDRSDEALATGKVGTSRVVTVTYEGNTQGQTVIALNAIETNVARAPARTELTKIAADFVAGSPGIIDEAAKIVQSHVADSGAGVMSDGSLEEVASSDGGRVYLQVSAITLGGYTSMQVKLQESSDNGAGDAWADVVTSAAITVAPTAEIMTIAAGTAIEEFTRAFLVLNGAGSGESITALVALARD